MNWSQWVSCLLSCAVAVAASALPACKRGPAWQVLGDSTRAKASESLPERSAFFDGERVSLRGARGETLGITVRSADGRARRVRLELPSNVAGVAGFEVRTLEVKEPSTDMYGKSLGKGRYPDVLVPRSGALAATEHVYFDVAVRHDAVPGSYAGTLWVDERQLDVDLKVSTAEIELERDPAVWVFYLPREVARVHGLADGDSAELVAKEAEYHQLFRAHGAFLAADLAPDWVTKVVSTSCSAPGHTRTASPQ